MKILEREGRRCCNALLKPELVEHLKACTDFLTLGVDTKKDRISTTQAHIREPHAELVYVINLSDGACHFTGKSYPTPGQQAGLVRNTDLQNHFLELNGTRTMVLGCHDLTIYNPRSDATAKGWRSEVKEQFKHFAAKFRPKWVLHHPHTTVKKRTWLAAWGGLTEALPSMESYVGSGKYSRKDRGWGERDALNDVLSSTKSRDVMDVVVHMAST